jgi:hypothetical protein
MSLAVKLANDRILELKAALQRAISELGGSHTGHWDSTRQYGAGCPVCIREREVKVELRAILEGGDDSADH